MDTNDIFNIKEFYFLIYVVIINIYGITVMGIDKYKAKKERWRIRERNFFITALLGGAAGIMMGMTMFRHKTKHKSFYIGVPILYIVNFIFMIIILFFTYYK